MTHLLKDAWALAIETLGQVELLRLSERLALAKATRELGITNSNAVRYAYGLVVETIRGRNLIDKFVETIIKPKTLDDLSLGVQSFLRLYVYQIRVAKDWADPDLEEASRVAKLGRSILGWKNFRVVEQFLGLLLSRQIEPVVREETDEERTALQTFHPKWFVEYCFRLFGRSEAIAFLEGSVYPPPFFVRLNLLKAPEGEIIAKLDAEGVKLEKTEQLDSVFKVTDSKRPLTSLQTYRDGMFYVQDKASCFAAEVANPKPGMTVLDVCASPGAKTTHLAQLMRNKGSIYSVDFSPRRIKTWRQEIQRMSATIAEPVIADARGRLPFTIEADVVLLDPPCTSTGSFGRQPSAKWRLSQKSAQSMAEIQWQMINSCAENVKPNGFLVYTTCSVTVEENEVTIERFLKWHPEFQLAEIKPQIGMPGMRGLSRSCRFYPHFHESNGYFLAKLEKR